jgi:L-aspartate oxidase
VELRNLVTVGELVMSSALQRRESRGGHYCADYPEAVPQECVATVINTPVKRRLDLAKVSTGGAVLFGGPSSPKRGAGARSGDLLTTRSGMEE